MNRPSVIDVAQYVYDRLNWVDSVKLQKLVYYSQAWHLAWDGRPLFPEGFEAWPNGPVSRDLFRVNKHERQHQYGTRLPGADTERIPPRSKSIIDAVLEHYGTKNSNELIELTHQDSPWTLARGDLPTNSRCAEYISTDEIRRCYTVKSLSGSGNLPSPPAIPVPCVEAEGYHDAMNEELERWSEVLTLLADR